ncbi:hypothetical protein D9619_008685 [Psilocybe cf. subviscida]|uniref:Signal peptidase complex subunit 1 n=1 Tax=Psilocybe cf. subviscida TaxID=2480587 RepID=A0A8H5BAH4_9AGAR|nr:hypothetical protein D9619_008685 [Psilocybe cf. subviscida]
MSASLSELAEGKIDFEGQHLVELIAKVTLVGSSMVAFCIGFTLGDIRVTFGIMAVATVLLAAVVLPPWPMFNRHPVKWLTPKAKKE